MAPRRQTVPPLVGRREAAEILGVHPNNIGRISELPEPLQDRVEGMAVKATPLWTREEVEAIRDLRAAA